MGAVNVEYWESLLYTIGAPYSANALQAFMEWQRYEGGNARYNPLNSTVVWLHPRSTRYNSAGVQNYVTQPSGVGATATTLLNGRYPAILEALRGGWTVTSWNTPPIIAELDTWGTVGFADYLRTLPVEVTVDPELAQMIRDIHAAIYLPVEIDGGTGYPQYAPPNNIDIVRRTVHPYNAGYPPAVSSAPPEAPTVA